MGDWYFSSARVHGQLRRIVSVRRRGETEQAYSGFGLGLQLGQHIIATDADGAGLGVHATASAQGLRSPTINHLDHHRLTLADRCELGGELGLRAELLRAVGTSDQAEAGHGDQTEQQTLQHARFSRKCG